MSQVIQIFRKWGFIHLLKVSLILLWRWFPWPKERGKYFTKRFIEKLVNSSGFVPMWTEVGWLLLEKQGDVLQNMLYMSGTHYETEVINFIEKEFRSVPNILVFDVGSHVGYYTLLLAKKVGRQGKIVAFEPQTELAGALQSTLKLNNIYWAAVENVALSDSCGHLILFQAPDNGRTSAANILEDKTKKLVVSAIALDDYIKNHSLPVPDLIKMDIEGAEWFAIKGMVNLLTTPYPPKLVIEMHPAQIQALGGMAEEIVTYISETTQYKLYWIHPTQGLLELGHKLPTTTTWHLFASPKKSKNG